MDIVAPTGAWKSFSSLKYNVQIQLRLADQRRAGRVGKKSEERSIYLGKNLLYGIVQSVIEVHSPIDGVLVIPATRALGFS